MRRSLLLATLSLLALTLGGVGCSGGSDSQGTETATPHTSTQTPSPEATPTATPAPPDVAGSKDFYLIHRYPGSYIDRWDAHGTITDCQGVGPVAAYEHWVIAYKQPATSTATREIILAYYKDQLVTRGWHLARSDESGVLVYTRTDPGALSYLECNPAGQTDWVSVVVQPDAGSYSIEVVTAQGSDPYAVPS